MHLNANGAIAHALRILSITLKTVVGRLFLQQCTQCEHSYQQG
jgi:hypothetical protein